MTLGVAISTAVSVDDPVPRQFFGRDPDGDRFLIVQRRHLTGQEGAFNLLEGDVADLSASAFA
jgi:hypothetical protein